jgi:uncharacterized protein (DUF58 family)
MEEIHYRLPARIRGAHPGFHRSNTIGGGNEFREHELLLRSPDPRRVDLHASLKNPFGELLVRVFNQRAAISVSVVADLSASMGAPGSRGKLEQLSRFISLLGYSVSRTGDRFGFVGCDENVRTEFIQPPMKRSAVIELVKKLEAFVPTGASAEGLACSSPYLGRARGLVFLVSDYLFPEKLLRKTFEQLSRHAVVPVMLSHTTDIDGPAGFGFVRAIDSETGRSRMVWLRPSLRQRIRTGYQNHQQNFAKVCAHYGVKPLLLAPSFSAEDITRYFYSSGRSQ